MTKSIGQVPFFCFSVRSNSTLSANIQFLESYSDFIVDLIDEVWKKISYDKGLYQFGILETSPYFDTTRNYFPMQEIDEFKTYWVIVFFKSGHFITAHEIFCDHESWTKFFAEYLKMPRVALNYLAK